MARKPYPSDVTDEEWDLVAPSLTLMTEDAPQREHDLREVFNGMRYVVRGGHDAQRPAAVVCRVPAGAGVDRCRRVRGDDPGPAADPAAPARSPRRADRGD